MDTTIITAIISAGATLVVCLINNYVSQKRNRDEHKESMALIQYKIEQLTASVTKHNNLIDRMYKVENKLDILENKQSVADHRIQDLEDKEK